MSGGETTQRKLRKLCYQRAGKESVIFSELKTKKISLNLSFSLFPYLQVEALD